MQAGMTQKFTANSQDQAESSSEDEDSTDPGKSHKPLTQGGRQGGARAFPIFEASKTSAFSTNAQSRFASVVFDGVLGRLRLAQHT